MSHAIIPLSTYIKVFIALLFLTLITVLASMVNFGSFDQIIAFGIAGVKAGLVAWFFMGLKNDSRVFLAILLLSIFFLFVFYFFPALDIGTRVPVVPSL